MAHYASTQTITQQSTQTTGWVARRVWGLILNMLFLSCTLIQLNAGKKILVTGGAGYIGSHVTHLLQSSGYEVIVLDKHSGKQPLPKSWAQVINADIATPGALSILFQTYEIDTVIHLAASIELEKSVTNPDAFYYNNVINTLLLLDVMRTHGVKKFIFASSCSIYGQPGYTPMDEQHPFAPTNPYSKTKLITEYILQDYARAYDLRYVVLRFFNAAGASPELGLGEQHEPETHVIPLLLRAIKNDTPFTLFGTDYPTPDGTAIRDYVHVKDIADSQLKALQYLDNGGKSDVFNIGTDAGCSVKQLVDVAGKVCSKPAKVIIKPRRPGDTATLVASSEKARTVLGWKPLHSDLETILKSAWEWEQRSL